MKRKRISRLAGVAILFALGVFVALLVARAGTTSGAAYCDQLCQDESKIARADAVLHNASLSRVKRIAQAEAILEEPYVPPVTSTSTTSATGTTSTSTSTSTSTTTTTTPPPLTGLHVSGNQLLDGSTPVHLHGVNYSGTEYACIQGWGIFDGPSDDAMVTAIKSWSSNIVRIPLNEDCWLGINGVPAAYSGANYRNAIANYVNLLHQHGLYAELSLMWAAPGSFQATYQDAAPDEDHSPAMWTSLAGTFKTDPKVILAPWGETVVHADCFLNGGPSSFGGVCDATFGSANTLYTVAGMQQAVDTMRAAGYQGVIAIPGIDFANDMTQWLSHKPNDPLGNLIAEMHIYGNNTCGNPACLDSTVAPVAAQVPVIFGEYGETYDASSCGSTNTQANLAWADAHNVGYEAWTWDTWGNCSALIANFDGTPYSAYGSYVRTHYLAQP